MAQTEEFILTRSPNDTFRKQVMEGFTGNKAKVSQIYNDLDRVQTAYVDSVDTLLEWCSSQVGKWNVTNGRLMFSSIKQQTELSQLAAKLQAAEDAVNATVVNVSAIQTQIQDKRQKAFSEAEKILK